MFIADENINFKIVKSLRELGIDIIAISEQYPGISDDEVIKLATNPPRILLTEDKDFGEWVFAHDIKNISVIFLRYHHKDILSIISSLITLIKNNPEALFGKFVTVTINKIRIRNIN